MEVVGLVIGIISTWKTCAQLFDVVAQSREYGPDFELYRIKLEVEKVRLLAWGDAVGLGEADAGRSQLDERLKQDHKQQVVLQVLGGIQKIFEDTEGLRDRYGLIEQGSNSESSPTLSTMLQKAGAGFKRMGKQRQQASTLKLKTLWVIHDRTKFLKLVTDVRSFNDNLRDLFPDLSIQQALRKEIAQIKELRSLTLIQQASAENPDVSDVASRIIEERTEKTVSTAGSDNHTLTSSASARHRMSSLFKSRKKVQDTPTVHDKPVAVTSAETVEAIVNDEGALDALEKQLDEFESKKNRGELSVSFNGPSEWSAQAIASSSWRYYQEDSWTSFRDRDKGFVVAQHAAFESYRRKKYMKRLKLDRYPNAMDEDYIMIDAEADPRYEHQDAGTITVEGFALECWEYEELFGKPRPRTYLVATAMPPRLSIGRLLRRHDELQNNPGRFGINREQDLLDLNDFLAGGTVWLDPNRAYESASQLSELYSNLNRTDAFAEFVTESPISALWSGQGTLCNLLWQMILGKELGRRWAVHPDSWINGITVKVLTTVIISDLWMENVCVKISPLSLPEGFKKTADADAAKRFEAEADSVFKNGQFDTAVELYTKALVADGTRLSCVRSRLAAFLRLRNYELALWDATIITLHCPQSAEDHRLRGVAQGMLNLLDDAVDSHTRAIELAGANATPAMIQGLADAQSKVTEFNKKVDAEKDNKKRHELISGQADNQWSLLTRTFKVHSNVHERQVDALRYFAERMRWPYLNELRDTAEDIYHSMINDGRAISWILMDWLYGLSLPGKYFAFKLMTALIQCSPLSADLGVARYYASNVVLPKQTYWRVNSVLGRVLGPLPNVKSICGWLGPCPPVTVDPPHDKPLFVRLKARRVSPNKPGYDNTIYIGGKRNYEATAPAPDENLHAYLAEMTDDENWVVPQPPVQSMSVNTLDSIKLKKLVCENTKVDDKEQEYRASLDFTIDGRSVTYTLYTAPVFVTPPPCYDGPHTVHRREAKNFAPVAVDVEMLKEYYNDFEENNHVLINATGRGADVLARAWCCENGKNAIIVRESRLCLVCAMRSAVNLDIPVIIWVS